MCGLPSELMENSCLEDQVVVALSLLVGSASGFRHMSSKLPSGYEASWAFKLKPFSSQILSIDNIQDDVVG